MSETRDDLLTVTDSGAVFHCVVPFHNELPPQWNVHIVAIGARFSMTTEQTFKWGRHQSTSPDQMAWCR
jgi:hypothetical protein